MGKKINKKRFGFTIVELLIVIVIIGILAAIVFVSYTNTSKKAQIALLQSELKSASSQLAKDYVLTENYPATLEAANEGRGLASSSSVTVQYSYDSTNRLYCISMTSNSNSNLVYHVSSDNQIPAEGGCEVPLAWSSIALGTAHTCLLTTVGKVYCVGAGGYGQLGNNLVANSTAAVAIDTTGVLNGKTVKSITSKSNSNCAIASDNLAYCWGYNASGQLGNNSTTNSPVPVAVVTTGVLSGKTIKSISSGSNFACAVASDDQVYCWGDNTSGQLGNNSVTASAVPVAVDTTGVLSGKTVKSISLGGSTACVIASDDQVYCWGLGTSSQLGNNTAVNSSVPVAVVNTGVLSGKTVKALSSGSNFVCAMASDNNAYCWGTSTYGQLYGSTVTSSVPVASISGLINYNLAATSLGACAITTGNTVSCWGRNNYGQVGNGNTTDQTSGYLLAGITAKSVFSGPSNSCVINLAATTVFCWGRNDYGQLNTGATGNLLNPNAIQAPTL